MFELYAKGEPHRTTPSLPLSLRVLFGESWGQVSASSFNPSNQL